MLNVSKVEQLISDKGWKKPFFCALFDKERGWISDWKRGRGLPDDNLLSQIADKLDTTVEYLTDQTDIKEKPATQKGDELSKERQEVINLVMRLNPEQLKGFRAFLDITFPKDNA